jgi:hypothetical protein
MQAVALRARDVPTMHVGDASFGRCAWARWVEAWFWSHDAERGNEDSPRGWWCGPPLARGRCFVTIGGEGGTTGTVGAVEAGAVCEMNPVTRRTQGLRNEPYDRGRAGFAK